MRKYQLAAICGIVLFVAGFALATGVERNPLQAIPMLICLGIACLSFRYAERKVNEEQTIEAHKRADLKKRIA